MTRHYATREGMSTRRHTRGWMSARAVRALVAASVTLAFAFATRGVDASTMGALRTTERSSTSLVTADRYAIEGALEMRPLKSMGVDTREVRITLGTERHGKIRSALRADGTFTVPDAPPGTHVLDVHATGLTYPPIRIRIYGENEIGGDDVKDPGTIEAVYAEDKSVSLETKPLRLSPVSVAEYYEPSSSISIRAIMKNPMALMVIMTVFLAYVAPKLLEAIDPEELKQMQEELAGRQRPSGSGSTR